VKFILNGKEVEFLNTLNNKHACRVYSYCDEDGNFGDIEIDLELVPLMELLWDLGIETYYSCQGMKKGEIKNPNLDSPELASEFQQFGYIALSKKGFGMLEKLPRYSEIKKKYLERIESEAKCGKAPDSVVIRFKDKNIYKIVNLVKVNDAI